MIICRNCGYHNIPGSPFCEECGLQLMNTDETSSSPELIGERYRVINKIAKGGMGAIYLAEDIRLANRRCVVKELLFPVSLAQEKESSIKLFSQEVNLLATLSHPSITNVFDSFSEKERYYFVMEFIEGETLESKLEKRGSRFPGKEVIKLGIELCDALTYLHTHIPPIIFRDLKPSNVMITTTGNLKLIDFGIARFFRSGKAQDTQALGTPGYASPEQYGRGQTDARSDIYSLGVTLYHLLTNYDPVNSPFNLPTVKSQNPDVSNRMEEVIQKAIKPNPDERYQSADELKSALLEAMRLLSRPKVSEPVIIPLSYELDIAEQLIYEKIDQDILASVLGQILSTNDLGNIILLQGERGNRITFIIKTLFRELHNNQKEFGLNVYVPVGDANSLLFLQQIEKKLQVSGSLHENKSVRKAVVKGYKQAEKLLAKSHGTNAKRTIKVPSIKITFAGSKFSTGSDFEYKSEYGSSTEAIVDLENDPKYLPKLRDALQEFVSILCVNKVHVT